MEYQLYIVTNKENGKAYIGKTKNKIGINYWTSSKDKEFRNDFKNNPDKYNVKVIATFDCPKKAIGAEIYLHNLFNVGKNPMFYNRAKQTSAGFDTTGMIMGKEFREKCSLRSKGEKNGMFGKKQSIEGRQRISDASSKRQQGANNVFFGKTHTKEQKEKWSKERKGKTLPKEHVEKIKKFRHNNSKVCDFCGKLVEYANFKRWHGEKCKLRINTNENFY